MKFTQLLYKHHIGRAISQAWYNARKRVIVTTAIEENLLKLGIQVKDPLEVLQPKKLLKDKTQNDVLDKTKVVPTLEKKMYSYKDHNVLQGGISQAQLLTHTVQVGTELPKQIKDGIVDLPENVENLVKGIMYNSYIYDAHQELLPKRKDPNRPMWVFPRDYGLTTLRKSQNVSRKFLQLCESLCGLNIASDRGIIYNGHASIIIERSGDPIFLDLGMDLIVTSTKPLSPFLNPNESIGMDLPDIRPLHYTIGLEKRPMNSMQDTCAIEQNALTGNVHTIIIYHIPESTKNITLLPVTQDQILACSLMKSFTAAACYARQKFGADVQELPQPVTVQCIQSNSQDFHFSVFQLNTLDILHYVFLDIQTWPIVNACRLMEQSSMGHRWVRPPHGADKHRPPVGQAGVNMLTGTELLVRSTQVKQRDVTKEPKDLGDSKS